MRSLRDDMRNLFASVLHMLRKWLWPDVMNSASYVWHENRIVNGMETTERKTLTRALSDINDRHINALALVASIDAALAELSAIPTVGFWDTFVPTGEVTKVGRKCR